MRKLTPILLLALAALCGKPAAAQSVAFTKGTMTAACPAANAATGTCPAGSYIILNPGSYTGIRALISGATTFSATVQLWASPYGDCNDFQPLSIVNKSNVDTLTMSATASGMYDSNGMNSCNAMLIVSSYTSGTVTASLTAGPAMVSFSAAASGATVTVSNFPLDGSGNIKVATQTTTTVAGSGTAGAAAGGVLTVQGANGMTPVNTVNAGSWSYFLIPASTTCVTAACVIKTGAGTFGGIINLSTTQQPAGNCTWWDNTGASGSVMYLESQIGSGQIITIPLPGLTLVIGLTVQCAATPGGSGILVLYR